MALSALWHLALYGTPRSMELRAPWNSALHGTPRSMELRALWNSALYGTPRSMELRAVMSGHQSNLSVMAGSTCDALRAGIHAASAATRARIDTAIANIRGSP